MILYINENSHDVTSSGTCILYINDNSHDVTSSGTCILYINDNSHDVTSSGTCILYINDNSHDVTSSGTCVQLSHNFPNSPKYILCNVYRLPCYLAADIDLFNAKFCSLLRTVKHRNSSVLICGDFNIDLLSVTSNRHVTEYFDNVISSVFFPK